MENTTQSQQITVSDLEALRAIVDIAVKRGAFNAREAADVGTVYVKLDSFLNAVVAQAAAANEAAAASNESTDSQGE